MTEAEKLTEIEKKFNRHTSKEAMERHRNLFRTPVIATYTPSVPPQEKKAEEKIVEKKE